MNSWEIINIYMNSLKRHMIRVQEVSSQRILIYEFIYEFMFLQVNSYMNSYAKTMICELIHELIYANTQNMNSCMKSCTNKHNMAIRVFQIWQSGVPDQNNDEDVGFGTM